jgi:hypothetical protein
VLFFFILNSELHAFTGRFMRQLCHTGPYFSLLLSSPPRCRYSFCFSEGIISFVSSPNFTSVAAVYIYYFSLFFPSI